jgi:hypothetical protein
MKKLLTPIFTIALFFGSCHDHGVLASTVVQDSEPAKVAGKWRMTMDTPHGAVKGPFQVQQDGAKLTGTFEAEIFGTLSATGSVDGHKVSFSLSVPNAERGFAFSGTLDGAKMSGKTEMGGEWSANRE